MAKHLTRQSFPIKTDPFSVPLILCWIAGYRIYIYIDTIVQHSKQCRGITIYRVTIYCNTKMQIYSG